jgi:serine O-acetyltransferase
MAFMFLRESIRAYREKDPAARSSAEVFFCYPGFHAVLWHLVASRVWHMGAPSLGRFVAHIGRWLTGIEIHPAAKLGRRLVIDHGMGLVIGETAEVGDDVTLYHQVTLGGTSLNHGKRHPTIGDGVIIGAGAKILGAITVGAGARIGANALVVRSVPAGTTMVGAPARPLDRGQRAPCFDAYGTPCGEMSVDPLLRDIENLRLELAEMEVRLDRLAEANRLAERAETYRAPAE